MYVVYIDDIIIFCKTNEQHLDNSQTVFDRIRSFNLKLCPENVFKTKISFLGHVVSGDGIQTDPKCIR